MQQFIAQVAPALATLLAALLVSLMTLATNQLRLKFKGERTLGILDRIDHLAQDVVEELKQTVVDGMKAANSDGKITAEEADAVRAAALMKLKSHLGPAVIADLMKLSGFTESDLDLLLKTKIEAQVSGLR